MGSSISDKIPCVGLKTGLVNNRFGDQVLSKSVEQNSDKNPRGHFLIV